MKISKHIRNFALLAAVGFSAASCVVTPTDGNDQTGGEGTTVLMALNVPGVPSTRGLTSAQQDAIHFIDVLAFDSSGNLSDWQYGTVKYESGVTYFTVRLRSSESAADTYRLMVLANSRAVTYPLFHGTDLNGHRGDDYADVVALLEGASTTTTATLTSDGIPMWGEIDNLEIRGTSLSESVTLIRSLARIDVGTNPAGVVTDGDGYARYSKLSNFSLEEVYVYKGTTKYRVAPTRTKFDFGTNNATDYSLPSTVTKMAVPYGSNDVSRDGTVGIAITAGLFCPEADVKMGGTLADSNHENRSAVVVGGKYNGSTTTTYYRIDFTDGGSSTALNDILRNRCYQMVIRSVSGSGFEDKDDAYRSNYSQIEAEVVEWGTAGQTVIIDRQWKMTLTRDNIFSGNEGTIPGKDIFTVVNTTNTAAGLKIENPVDSLTATTTGAFTNWFTFSVDGSDASAQRTITVKDVVANTTGVDRTGIIRITSGNMVYDFKVRQKKDPWITAGDNIFLLDGELHKLDVTSLTDWSVKILDDGINNIKNGENLITGLIGSGGTAGTTDIHFHTYDDIYTGTRTMGNNDVVLTFTHGDYLSKDIAVTAVSAYFGKESNCYMMDWNNPMALLVPVSQVGRAMSTTSTSPLPETGLLPSDWITDADFTSSTAPLRAQVLWSDVNDFTTGAAVVRGVAISGASLADGLIVVVPGKPYIESGVKGGNSLVILYKDNNNTGFYDTGDEIKWSWHIWNTDYVPGGNALEAISIPPSTTSAENVSGGHLYRFGTNNNNTWMDRNLGAIGGNVKPTGFNKDYELGFHYQWGRKDPLPGSNMASANSTANRTNIYYAPTVPTALRYDNSTTKGVGLQIAVNWPQWHNYNTVSPYDWYGATSCYELWGQPSSTTAAWNAISTAKFVDQTTGKSAYDPCPEGWRVPRGQQGSADTYSPWSGWQAQTFTPGRGYDHTSYGYWPAAGYRNTYSATLGNVGSYGYYWSSSLSSANAANSRDLYLRYNNGINPSNNYNRGGGFSVRCVAE